MVRRSTGLLAFLIALLSLPAAATNYTGSGNATVMSLGSPSANCVGWPSCPTVLNSAAAPLYTLDPTVNASIQSLLTALAAPLPLPTGASTSQLQTTANGYLANISGRVTGNLALDSSIQSLLTALQAPLTFNLPTNAATATNQATANGYLLTLATASASQATGAKQDTGNTSAATTAANTTTIANAQGAQGTGSTFNPPAGGSGIIGYLSGIFKAITGTLTVSGTVTATAPATATALTPGAPPGAVLTLIAGGNSQNLANANACANFIYIQNGQSIVDQGGIAAVEPIYVNLTGSAASVTPGGQSFAIYPGTTPIFVAQTTSIKWVAATTGHAINAWCE